MSCIKQSQEEFITKLKSLYGDKYDYSKTIYNGITKPTCIICAKHGEIWRKASYFMKSGCNKCGVELSNKNKTHDTDYFINKCIQKFGNKYDYSKTKYINAKTNTIIICPRHGELIVKPYVFLQNNGCKYCSYEKIHERTKYTNEEFIKKSKEIHGDTYDYSKVDYYNNATNITLICKIHGEFDICAGDHLKGCGCSKCHISHKERDISNILVKMGFIENKDFYTQYKFDNCINYKTNKKLPFDFYIPKYNICIEYDGYQHYTYPNRYHKTYIDFIHCQQRDLIKTSYCFENNINLLRLTEKDELESTIKYHFNRYVKETKEIPSLTKFWWSYLHNNLIDHNMEAIEWLNEHTEIEDEKASSDILEKLKENDKEKILKMIKDWEEKYNCKW